MQKLTSKPIRDKPVAYDIRIYGVRNLEKRLCSIMYTTLSIQGFALMLLFVYTVDPDEFVLRLGKLDAEFLDGLFEMCDFVV